MPSDRICCYCRQVYGQVDTSEPSHGVCPECSKEMIAKVLAFEREQESKGE